MDNNQFIHKLIRDFVEREQRKEFFLHLIVIMVVSIITTLILFWWRSRRHRIEDVLAIDSHEIQLTDVHDPVMGNQRADDEDPDQKQAINPICRALGHDWDDPPEELYGTPAREIHWLMGHQPTYRQHRKCQRDGCTKTNMRMRTNVVTKGPWKDLW